MMDELKKYFEKISKRQIADVVKVVVFFVIIHFSSIIYQSFDLVKNPKYVKNMEPSITEDSTYYGKHISNWKTLKYSDIVYYQHPYVAQKNRKNARRIGRILGFPGDQIEFRQGKLYRNNQKIEETYTQARSSFNLDIASIIVPRYHVYILEDKRVISSTSSGDSRFIGPILGDFIEGIITTK